MNLVIDIGNSGAKLAVFNEGRKIIAIKADDTDIEKKLSQYKFKNAIVSTVRSTLDEFVEKLTARIPFVHFLSYKSRLPFTIEYDTPETLGSDRIAAAAGAYLYFPGADVLVIDAGTAITYEFLSGKNYNGGNISPGMTMRFKALNKFTGRLPLVKPADFFTSPGKNTNDAIIAGVLNGIIYEINEYIRAFQKKYPQAKVILTGGDGNYLKPRIGNPVVNHIPDLVLDGLNYILECNAK
ncbi:MAG: type III pantothenate kinase [Bacteroidales bacterium]|nr:type III pantothenate kinase [Bacteroidales bacterium]